LQTATSPFEARSIRVRIANSPMTDFLASSIASGGGSGTAYRPPVICRMNEPLSLVDGEYIANNPPTKEPALAFFRSIWPRSSPRRKSGTTSEDADLYRRSRTSL
jgi:hypothetical protein